MPKFPALIDLKELTENKILRLFDLASSIEKNDQIESLSQAPAALLFFEPSTRTRMSFQMACGRLGLPAVVLSGKSGTSLEKGETLEDTLLNIAAMKPSILIVRAQDELPMKRIAQEISLPWVNAGWGKQGHPTQALLDAQTMRKFLGELRGKKILFVGDVRHSRVAVSHIELSKKLNYQMGVCGPPEFLFVSESTEARSTLIFDDLEKGLAWADVVIALRVQNERHDQQHQLDRYHQEWGLNEKKLSALSKGALLLHPGPINHGVELDPKVFSDSRCRILEQVTQGVYLRQALLKTLLQNPGELS